MTLKQAGIDWQDLKLPENFDYSKAGRLMTAAATLSQLGDKLRRVPLEWLWWSLRLP